MNFKILHLAAALAVVALFSSCQHDEEVISNESYYQTISAEFVEPEDALQTRSCVDVRNPNTSFVGLLWQVADKLGVFTASGKENAEFSNTATENAPKAEFGGSLAGEAKYAYFPFSKSSGTNVTSLSGQVLSEQPFNPEDGTLVCDYKVGTRVEGTNTFKFEQILTMLRITIDASNTDLEGERLNKIVLTVTDKNGNARNISGDFTFNATNGDVTASATRAVSNVISMPWTTRPELSKDKSYQGFISLLPDMIKQGDVLTIEVTSDAHRATFSLGCLEDLIKGFIYEIPLKLKELLDKYKDDGKADVEELTVPTITAFSFNVSNNSGKLLDTKLKWSTSSRNVTTESVSSYPADSFDGKTATEITMTIPYLYDFKLKPTFTANGTVTVNGNVVTSGETEVDFTNPVTFTVTGSDGATNDYTVKVTNTGLPIVVINQSGTGDLTVQTKSIGSILAGGTHKISINKLADIPIRPKDSTGNNPDWVTDDVITVYNADGTIDCSATGGVRLRGNTTQEYPKKPFAIKLTEKKSVLGMPKHKRWVLLANWLDHSMIRNTVAFDIAQAMEYAWRQSNGAIGDGIPWSVHGQNVELILVHDGKARHVGNYLLCEQIKIDGDRLDIQDPYEDVVEDNNGSATFEQCGYLLEIDNSYDEDQKFKTSKGVPFMFKDAVPDDFVTTVNNKVQGIETNLYKGTDAGYTAAFNDLDINSVIDQMLIWELTMNREYGDPKSIYMFMNGNGKLSAGPVWDFDRGTFQNPTLAKALCNKVGIFGGNDPYYRVKDYGKWLYSRTEEDDDYSYVWYRQLVKSQVYKDTVKARWAVIYPVLKSYIPVMIQTYGQNLAKSYAYDSAMWPTSKEDIRYYKYDFNDWSGDETLGANGNYQEVVNNLIEVFNSRLEGMNTLITSGSF